MSFLHCENINYTVVKCIIVSYVALNVGVILIFFPAGTPPLGSSTGMTTFSNLPNRNLPFTLTLNVQPRCGQATFDVTRQFRRGMNGKKSYCLIEWFTGVQA